MTADLAAATRFLSFLADGESVSFQTFADAKNGHAGQTLVRILHGSLANYGATLETLNQSGAGIFVMVNAGDCKGRAAGNVVRVRALFADLDGSPLGPVLIAKPTPHLIIESSPDRFHAYWLVIDCPLDHFTSLQAAIAVKFDSDPKVKDLPRVMRMPGFWHQKDTPFMSRIIFPE